MVSCFKGIRSTWFQIQCSFHDVTMPGKKCHGFSHQEQDERYKWAWRAGWATEPWLLKFPNRTEPAEGLIGPSYKEKRDSTGRWPPWNRTCLIVLLHPIPLIWHKALLSLPEKYLSCLTLPLSSHRKQQQQQQRHKNLIWTWVIPHVGYCHRLVVHFLWVAGIA